MPLCSVCESIDFNQLPVFPESEYSFKHSKHQYSHSWKKLAADKVNQDFERAQHHDNLSNLRAAASEGCPICLIIANDADKMFAEYEKLPFFESMDYIKPNFNLWLSKRGWQHDQGFWVWSANPAFHGNVEIVLVSAFVYTCSNYDDPLVSEIKGRFNFTEAEALQQVVKWDNDCTSNHSCCLCCSKPETMPPYLIKVNVSDAPDFVEVVKVTRTGVSWVDKYTALSYVPELQVSGYLPVIAPFQIGAIAIDTLPRVFRDAISVTRALGVLNLWINTLCTPPRSKSWRRRHSENFASVYENAYLTISATGSKRITDGLFFSRLPRQSADVPYKPSGGDDESESATVTAWPLALPTEVIVLNHVAMKDEPMTQDIWSFQERVLSRRTVHFATNQMYFECLFHFVSEDGLVMGSGFHSTIEDLANLAKPFWQTEGSENPFSRWCSLLYDYGRRQPGLRPNDRLLALATVARRYSTILQDEYVVGHWRRRLLESLAWRATKPGSKSDVDVPSWSVLAIDGCTDMMPCEHDKLARILKVDVDWVDDGDPFGKVHSATIDIRGPLIPLVLCSPSQSFLDPDMRIRLKDDKEHHRIYFSTDIIDRDYNISSEAVEKMEMAVLIIKRNHRKVVDTTWYTEKPSLDGLVLTPVDLSSDRPKWKRIGFITFPSLRLSDDKLEAARKVLTLV